jgi:hypothetical protein
MERNYFTNTKTSMLKNKGKASAPKRNKPFRQDLLKVIKPTKEKEGNLDSLTS